jgi:hypothetical protein
LGKPESVSDLEQEAHELLESRDLLCVCPEGHDLLEVVELTHRSSNPIFISPTALKGVIQLLDVSDPVTSNTLSIVSPSLLAIRILEKILRRGRWASN